jgi:hypothetical protein
MKQYLLLSISFILVGFFVPQKLYACPMCHTTTAEQVRANLFITVSDGLTIPAIVLPFVILGLILWMMHSDWRNNA